jgi:hypothetical protein
VERLLGLRESNPLLSLHPKISAVDQSDKKTVRA